MIAICRGCQINVSVILLFIRVLKNGNASSIRNMPIRKDITAIIEFSSMKRVNQAPYRTAIDPS